MRLNIKRAKRIPLALAISAGLFLAAPQLAMAEADGPDFYRVTGVASNDVLNIRAKPSGSAGKVGEIPPNADGVKNLGCQGGLSLSQWQKASPSRRRAAARSRWCRVTFNGVTGWVAGRFLAEGSAPRASAATLVSVPEQPILRKLSQDETLERISIRANGSTAIKGTIRGYKHKVYAVTIAAGDTLSIRFHTASTSAYFNLIDAGDASGAAIHRGDVAGKVATVTAAKPATYLIQPYVYRSAARRGQTAGYTFAIVHTAGKTTPGGSANSATAGAPAKFDATGMFKCSSGKPSHDQQCAFWVKRKGNSAATIWLKRPDNKGNRVLEFATSNVTSPQPGKISWGKQSDNWFIGIDNNEFYIVVDAAIMGG